MESIGPILGKSPFGYRFGRGPTAGSVGAGRKVHGSLQQRSYRVPFVEIIGAHSSVEATDEISMFAWGPNSEVRPATGQSGLPSRTDVANRACQVRKVPLSDSCTAAYSSPHRV